MNVSNKLINYKNICNLYVRRNVCHEELNFEGKTSEQILYMLTDPCRYDRYKRPTIDGTPTLVYIRIYIYFIGNVEAQHLVSNLIDTYHVFFFLFSKILLCYLVS